MARRTPQTGWHLLPPLIAADGLNNELERPHAIFHDGYYYLFWPTQQKVFANEGPAGPDGLYGMVSDHLVGRWRSTTATGGGLRQSAASAISGL